MRSTKIRLGLVILCAVLSTYTYAQGCSDAGLCTINSFKPNSTDSSAIFNNQFKFGVFGGLADNNVFVYGNYIEYNRQLNKKLGIDAKLTTLAQNGNGISVVGLSDVFLNTNYKVNEKLKLTIGLKVPLSSSNNTSNNVSLPMDYQSSLGTFDLLFGLGYEVKKIQFIAAMQQPLTQNNNQFFAAAYPLNNKLSRFQSTNNFKRSSDVLLRISYPINMDSKLKLTPSILSIYHLTNDKYTDEFNFEKGIKGSEGLTLNANVYIDYKIDKKKVIQLNIGAPFLFRDARPDGLTRKFIVNVEYRVKF